MNQNKPERAGVPMEPDQAAIYDLWIALTACVNHKVGMPEIARMIRNVVFLLQDRLDLAEAIFTLADAADLGEKPHSPFTS